MAATEPPSWLDELDLHVGAPDASMGTRALGLDDWFVVDDDWEPQRAEAAALIAERPNDVLVGLDHPAVAAPSADLLHLVRRHVTSRPGLPVPPQARGSVGQNGTGHPLVEARTLVADDLCLLLPDGDRWLLAAGAVCFPSYWRPAEKVGRPLADVHEPVPGYPGALADRVDGFLGRLRPGRGVRRRNWSVHVVPDLHVPTWRAPEVRPGPGERWLRSERQALVRLEGHDAVVFSIRTQQVPVAALAGRPDVCAGLAAALRGWSPAQRTYKGGAVDDALLAWLDDHAEQVGGPPPSN
ncbi:MAG: heme-dependent oxidative N-demethylase family protein [Acidimicrobiia bacterium]